jgi:hypothetical protein
MSSDARKKLSATLKIPNELSQKQFIKDQMEIFQIINNGQQSVKCSFQNHLGGEESKEYNC